MDKDALISALPGGPTATQLKCLDALASGEDVILTAPAFAGKSALVAAVAAANPEVQVLVVGTSRQRALRAAVQESATRLHGGGADLQAYRVGKVDSVSGFAIRLVTQAAANSNLPQVRLATEAETATWMQQAYQQVQWPDVPGPLARQSEQFQTELLEAVNRARDFCLTPAKVAELSVRHPQWLGVSRVLEQLLQMQEARRRDSRQGSWALDVNGVLDHLLDLLRGDSLKVGVNFPALLVVDDLHEVTAQVLELLELAASKGAQIFATANPDVATSLFRGGFTHAATELTGKLPSAHRVRAISSPQVLPLRNPELHQFYNAAVSLVEASDTAAIRENPVLELPAQPRKANGVLAPSLQLVVGDSPAHQLEQCARILANLHIDQGIPFGDMAVIVRTSADIEATRATLARFEIPVLAAPRATSLNAGIFSGPLLRLALRLTQGEEPTWEALSREMCSQLVGVHRFRMNELQLNPSDTLPDEDIVDLTTLQVPNPFVWRWFRSGERAAKARRKITAVARALKEAVPEEGNPAKSLSKPAQAVAAAAWKLGWLWHHISTRSCKGEIGLEEILWLIWDGVGHAQEWQLEALDLSVTLQRRQQLNEALDQVMDLFKVAQWWAQRNPKTPPQAFLTQQYESVVPQRAVAPHGRNTPGVTLTTPSLAAGQHWPVVALVGVAGRDWPRLTRHDQLLGAAGDALYQAAQSGVEAQVPVEADPSGKAPSGKCTWPDPQVQSAWYSEARQLAAAISRATDRLIIATVNGTEQTPSPFLYGILNRLTHDAQQAARFLQGTTYNPAQASSFTDILTQARGQALAETTAQAETSSRTHNIAQTLAWLQLHEYPQANPQSWVDYLPPSNPAPIQQGGTEVYLSPSGIQRIISSPLVSVLEGLGGQDSSKVSDALALGTLIHRVAQEVTEKMWPVDVIPPRQYSREEVESAVRDKYLELSGEPQDTDIWLERMLRKRIDRMLSNLATFCFHFQQRSLCEFGWRMGRGENSTAPLEVQNFRDPDGPGFQLISSMNFDRVMFDDTDSTLTIVDYKTGKPKYHDQRGVNANLQMAFYQYIARSKEFQEALGKPETFPAQVLNRDGITFQVKRVRILLVPLEVDPLDKNYNLEKLAVEQCELDAVIPKIGRAKTGIPSEMVINNQDKFALTNPHLPFPHSPSRYTIDGGTPPPPELGGSQLPLEYAEIIDCFLDDRAPNLTLRDYLEERLGMAVTIKTGAVFALPSSSYSPTNLSLQIQEW